MMNTHNIARNLILILIISTSFPFVAFGQSLSVETDQEVYLKGDRVIVRGTGTPETEITIKIDSGSDDIVELYVMSDSEGNYEVRFRLQHDSVIGEYTLTASAGTNTAETSFYIKDDMVELAQNLIIVLQSSHSQTSLILNGLDNVSNEIWDQFKKAEELMGEAIMLLEEEEYAKAAETATKAMSLFSEVTQEVMEEKSEKQGLEEGELRLALYVKIEKAWDLLKRFYEVSESLREKGVEISEILVLLSQAENELEVAHSKLEEGTIESVESQIDAAIDYLDEAESLIHEKNKEIKKDKAAKFLAQTQNRLNQLEQRILRIIDNIPDMDPNSVRDAFDVIDQKLLEIALLIESGELNEALDEFDEIFDESEDALRSLEEFNHKRSDLLRVVEKLEVKIHQYREVLGNFEETNTMKAYELLTAASELLEDAVVQLEKGNEEEAKATLEDVEKYLDWVEDIIEDIKEQWEKNNEDDEKKAEEIIELGYRLHKLKKSITGLRKLSNDLRVEKLDTQAIDTILNSAEELLHIASEYIEDENPKAADTLLDQASELAYKAEKMIHDLKDMLEDIHEFEENIDELLGKIANKRRKAATLEDFAEEINDFGLETGEAEKLINLSLDLLGEAEYIIKKNYDKALTLYKEAKGLLVKAEKILDEQWDSYNNPCEDINKVLDLIEEYETNCLQLRIVADELEDLGNDVSTVYFKLDVAWELLEKARRVLETDISMACSKASSGYEYIVHAAELIEVIEAKGTETPDPSLVENKKNLLQQYKIEANELKAWAHELAEEGVETSEAEVKIANSWELLLYAWSIVEETPEEVPTIIEEVNSILDAVYVILQEYQEHQDVITQRIAQLEAYEVEYHELSGWAEELSGLGMNVTEVENKLAEVVSLIGEAWELRESQDSIEHLFDEIISLLDEVRVTLEAMDTG